MGSEAGHTPGPWSANPFGQGDFRIVYNEAGNYLGEVYYDEEPFEERAKADANLIAAAPDMLDALQAAIENSDANVGPLGRTDEAQAVYDKVASAISKATGKS